MTTPQDFALQIGLLIGGVLLSTVLYVLKKVADFLSAKTKSSSLRSFWQRADDLAERVVKETYQATVKPLQDAGTWTPAAGVAAKQAAVSKLKSYLGPEGLKMLEYLIGVGDAKTLDAFLATFVEAAVHDTKTVVATADKASTTTVTTTTAALKEVVAQSPLPAPANPS